MKTAIKLILIDFAMQIIGALVVTPFAMLYSYIEYGTMLQANEISLAPSLLVGQLFMALYLWKRGYITGDKRMYSIVSHSFLLWSVVIGLSMIFLVDFIMSHLTFLPDIMKDSFAVLQSGWLGIACVAVIGPVVEELLFRGAITKVLLNKFSPTKAIIISGLLFGIFHINPVQVVGATLIGFLLAWIYYKTQSLMPCILIHILNNSLSVFLNAQYPDVAYTWQLMDKWVYMLCFIIAVGLFAISWRKMNNYKIPNTTIEL